MNCPICLNEMRKDAKVLNRYKYYCHCGHSALRESSRDLLVRSGALDKTLGILKLHTTQ